MSMDRNAVAAGQAVYDKRTLAIYDLLVLGLSNRWIWRCPTPIQLDHYNENLSANHLDVGVGTGYFLDQCRFPVDAPRVALMDLNRNSLEFSARRLARYKPQIYVAQRAGADPFRGGKVQFCRCKLPPALPSLGHWKLRASPSTISKL